MTRLLGAFGGLVAAVAVVVLLALVALLVYALATGLVT